MNADGMYNHRLKPTEAIDLANEPDFRLGGLHVRPSSREIVLDGRTETLEPRVMQVLTALARRRGEVVSREQLIESCWEGRLVSEDAINRSMTKVRRWSTARTFSLETIARVGYRLTAVEEPVADSSPVSSPAQAPLPVSAPPQIAPKRYALWKKILFGVLAVFAIIFVSGAWFGFQMMRDAEMPFFAVLQFDSPGSDPAADSLATALNVEINHRLTSQGFKVVSPAVSAQYSGVRKAEAATALDSRYIIDGSVSRDGDRLRVAVRIDASLKPLTVWSREYDVRIDESRKVTETVGIALASLFNPRQQSNPRLPPEVTAGMLRINELRLHDKDMEAYIAAKQFVRAVPTHYTPQIWYATSIGEALDLLPRAERGAALIEARETAERADSMVIGSLPTVRYALTPTVEWSTRERLLRDSISDDTGETANIFYVLSATLVSSGQIQQAIDAANQSVTLYPLSARYVAHRASVLDVAGQVEQAESALADAELKFSGMEYLERVRFGNAMTRGDWQAATALLQDPIIGPALDPTAERRPYAAILRALSTRAESDIAAVERDCADPTKLARDRASWCLQGLIALNRLDAFFRVATEYFPEQRAATSAERDARWLEAPRVIRYTRVLFRSDAKAVRADPRFIEIAERLGLLDYWRTTSKWPDFCTTEPNSVCGRMRALQ